LWFVKLYFEDGEKVGWGMGEMNFGVTARQRGLRIAALADIHGNIQALNAVLAELEGDPPDRIVVCGDVASGPFPSETLERLMELGEGAVFIRGNADRELLAAYDSGVKYNSEEEDPARLFAAWCAQQINPRQRDFLASFEDRVVLEVMGLGEVLFCHGSPRSDEEIITSLTPVESLEKILVGVNERVVVCGHTHHQFDRKPDGYRVINAGSIGMPYEDKPGAYWARLSPEVDLRRTKYDVERAVEQALATGYPDASYEDILLRPPKPDQAAAFFEEVAAGRGERS
jgi:putative phosphoesterase